MKKILLQVGATYNRYPYFLEVKLSKAKLSLQQAVEAYKVKRCRGSHIF
jgi:hypothetical protein